MSMESDKKNPWPLRILLASMACFVLGSVLVIGQMDALGDALDPQRNNVGSIDANSESQKLMAVEAPGCYRAYGVDFEGNVTLAEVEGCLLYTSPSPRD